MKTTKSFVLGVVAAAAFSAPAAGPIAVKVAKPEAIRESDGISIVGRVEGSHKVDLTARVIGTLWERNGEEGEFVKKGDVLYRIEDTIYKANLQTAKAQLAELAAQLAQAEIDAKRYTESESRGGVSKADRDRAVLLRNVVKAKLDAAQARVTLCENDLSYCTIASPIDGVLGCYAYDVGNNVGPQNGRLRDVVCTDPIDVVVAAPEQIIITTFENGRMKGNMRKRLLRSDGSEVSVDLEVFAIDNKVDSATGTVMVRFRGRNPERAIMPGGYVKLVLSEIYETPKIAVPMSAVVFEGEKRYVYVIANGKASKREVKLGEALGNRAIVEEGLKADEAFSSTGVHKLFDGADVKGI